MDTNKHLTHNSLNLETVSREFATRSQIADESLPLTFDWVASQMHNINHEICEAQTKGLSKEEILEILREVRSIQAQSPFVKRLQTWERGYPGDFETVEYLLKSENKAPQNSVAYWIEMYCLNTGIAQQHRNKVRFQADQVLETITKAAEKGKTAKILSIACGSSPDLKIIQHQIQHLDFLAVLNDFDADAISFSESQLTAINDKIKSVQGNTFRCVKKLAEHAPYDLILAGGLFDYLNNEQAIFLIKTIYTNLLAESGKFVFTNIANNNPYKIWMEYCANWFLIERSEDDIFSLLEQSGIPNNQVEMHREATGLTILIEIIKAT